MADINAEVEDLTRQAEAAATTSLENRERVAARCNAYADANSGQLAQWQIDQLRSVDEFLQLSTRAGTASNPNLEAKDSDGAAHPTSGAAKLKNDSTASEVFSQKTADDIGDNAKSMLDKAQKLIPDLLAPIIKGAAKGLWVYIAGAGAVLTLYVVAKKKGWL